MVIDFLTFALSACHFGSRIVSPAAAGGCNMQRLRVFPPLLPIAGRRRKSFVYTSLHRVAAQVWFNLPRAGVVA
jgi:hypothetical protein